MKPSLFLQRLRKSILALISFNSKKIVNVLIWANIFYTMLGIACIVYYYGYGQAYLSLKINESITLFCLLFYIVRFILRLLLKPDDKLLLNEHPIEACLVVLTLFFIPLAEFSGSMQRIHIGMLSNADSDKLYLSIFHLLLAFFILFEIGRASTLLSKLRISPAQLLIMSFLLIIFGGTGLLMLPQMSDPIAQIKFTDAFFTAASACSTTGLNVIDVSSVFTLKGQVVIMILIQVGGINMIAFATFFASMTRGYGGVKYQMLMKDFFHADKLSDTKQILMYIVGTSMIIELLGTVLIYLAWNRSMNFSNERHKIFYSLFHSISAFNNSGFTLFSDGFFTEGVRYNYNVQLTMTFLVFFGGLGFAVLYDVFGIKNIKERNRMRWKRLHAGSKLAIGYSFVLLVIGALAFYWLEMDNTLVIHRSTYGKFVSCLFQSMSTRTGGFNSVDLLNIGQPISILFIMLMFIGASPGSTGGGIKTTTFAVLMKSALSTIRNTDSINLFKRSISNQTISKAYAIASLSVVMIMSSTFVLSITEHNVSFLRLLFEDVSAFGNVGLSTGITPLMSTAGKYIIITNMFIGRIGTLTLILALTVKRDINYKYAESNIMIG